MTSDLPTSGDLRAALPQLWRRYGGAKGKESVTFTARRFRTWLRKHKTSPLTKLASAGEEAVSKFLRERSQRLCLKQRLGFRFKDPSKHGTWAVDNLQGYATKIRNLNTKRSLRGRTEVSWHSYVAEFQLRVRGSDCFEIRRRTRTNVVSARVQKRLRGDEPLCRETIFVTACSRRREASDRRKRIKIERRTADLLPAVIFWPVQPSTTHRWTLIFLHGMGNSALGNYEEKPHYFVDGTIALKVVIPTAPSRELTCFDKWWYKVQARGADKSSHRPRWRLMQFQAWYDYLTHRDGRREDDIDTESLHTMQRALHSVIMNEAAELQGRADRVILGGVSQGCCTALHAALTFPQRLGGFIGIVGHLLSSTPVDPHGPQAAMPLHFFHEVEDDIMRWAWVQKGEQRLREAGFNVHARHARDPEGHGHFIGGIEGRWVRSALQSICRPQG